MKNKGNDLVLVCISPSKSNSIVIKEAYKIAEKESAKLIALYVSPRYSSSDLKEKEYLQENIDLVESLGVMVEIIYDDDIATQIVNYAKLYKVKRIVIGRNKNKEKLIKFRKTVCNQVIEKSDRIDIHVVPVNEHIFINKIENRKNLIKDSAIGLLILTICTLIGYLFYSYGFGESNIIMIYMLGVFFIAMITYDEFISMISSIICVLAFNFCFTQPTLSLSFYNSNYIITFLVLLIVSFLTSRLASHIKRNAENSSNMIYISKLLLETNQLLQAKILKSDIIETGCIQLSNLLKRDIIYYDIKENEIQEPQFFFIRIRKKIIIYKKMLMKEK